MPTNAEHIHDAIRLLYSDIKCRSPAVHAAYQNTPLHSLLIAVSRRRTQRHRIPFEQSRKLAFWLEELTRSYATIRDSQQKRRPKTDSMMGMHGELRLKEELSEIQADGIFLEQQPLQLVQSVPPYVPPLQGSVLAWLNNISDFREVDDHHCGTELQEYRSCECRDSCKIAANVAIDCTSDFKDLA